MSCRSRKAKRAARVFSVSWFQQAPHSRGSCSGWKPERATEPTPGIHEPIWDLSGRWARDQWNTPSPGTQQSWRGGLSLSWKMTDQRIPPGSLARDHRPFHCFRPREGKSEHQGRSVLFSFFFLFFFMEPLSSYCLKWAVALQAEQVVKKCQMQLHWLRIISQKYTLTLRLFK